METRSAAEKRKLEEKMIKTIPTRLLCPRTQIEKNTRISQNVLETVLSRMRSKILNRPECIGKYNFFDSKKAYTLGFQLDNINKNKLDISDRVSVIEDFTDPLFLNHKNDYYGPENPPLIIHTCITTLDVAGQDPEGHAILLIYFPKEHTLDFVTTYTLQEQDEIDAACFLVSNYLNKGNTVIANLPTNINKYNLRDAVSVNLQRHEVAEVGWCVAWMMILTSMLSKASVTEYWNADTETRNKYYSNIYGQLLKRRGPEVWNELIAEYNKPGGKRMRSKRKTYRRKYRLRKTQRK